MQHEELRDDTECQNCGHEVTRIYCPHCGQKNTETRQSFGHLVGHFAEDLTHYDNAFWKTIKYLLFRPAFLTKEYLLGKRQAYVPPVKLYIFISFITFFLPAVLPDFYSDTEARVTAQHTTEAGEKPARRPSLTEKENVFFRSFSTKGVVKPITYTSVKEMDSIEALKPEPLRLSSFEHSLAKRLIVIYNHNTPEEVAEKSIEALIHNIPKALFVYLPIFAFWLWLFHSKKRWYFFEHGIFTLHYFSFLLLSFCLLYLFSYTTGWIDNSIIEVIVGLITSVTVIWQVYYFYRAHRKMYHEKLFINFIKSTALFVINMVAMLLVLVLFFYISMYTLH